MSWFLKNIPMDDFQNTSSFLPGIQIIQNTKYQIMDTNMKNKKGFLLFNIYWNKVKKKNKLLKLSWRNCTAKGYK